ncbi:MAG: OmpH family outer membrane protein, partial [Bryobacteraceae bacterium]
QFNRDLQDARADADQDEQKVLNELGQRMMVVIDKYARDHGFSVILDVSNPQTPVLYASNSVDITKDIIDLYDKNSPGPVSSGTSSPANTGNAVKTPPNVAPPHPATPQPRPAAPATKKP